MWNEKKIKLKKEDVRLKTGDQSGKGLRGYMPNKDKANIKQMCV